VLARVDGVQWETSVWRDRTYGTLLPVPKHVRGKKAAGDVIEVELLERASSSRPASGRRGGGRRAAD
jgi:hypothetical protein